MTSSTLSSHRALIALCVAAIGVVGLAGAATYVPMADETLAEQAALVAEVRIVAVDGAPEGHAATHYRAEIVQVLRGEVAAQELVVRVPGGVVGDYEMYVYGAPRFRPDQHAILFLAERPDEGTWGVLHLMLGAFHVREVGGRRLAVRDLREATPIESGIEPPRQGPRDAVLFSRWLRDHAGGAKRQPDYFLSDDEVAALGKFTLIDDNVTGRNVRWARFDAGQSANFFSHVSGQEGIQDGGLAAFQAALAVWRSDAATNIRYNYGGTTTATTGFNFFDNVNAILFGDPNSEVEGTFTCGGGGVIAAATPWWNRNQTHTYRGQTYHEIVGGDVITNDGTDCWLPFLNRAAEVFAHELGHTLGLGHSCDVTGGTGPFCVNGSVEDRATMRAQAHGDGRGASINADDRAAAAALYGSGGNNAPAAPSNLVATALTSSSIGLVWQDNSTTETGFSIERKPPGGTFSVIASVGADITQYTDTGLSPATAYIYRVKATAPGFVSAPSNQSQAITLGNLTPSQLTATAISPTSIRLQWQDNSPAETGFEVEGRTGGGFVRYASFGPGVEVVVMTDLLPGVEYGFRVRALTEEGPSTYSNEASATTPLAPAAPCVEDAVTTCLGVDDRFQVRVDFRDFEDALGDGEIVPFGSNDSGLLWFFDQDNWEMLVKIIDACGFNERFWVYAAATTEVEYLLHVTDTYTGDVFTFHNPIGNASPAVRGVNAFATCDAPAPAGQQQVVAEAAPKESEPVGAAVPTEKALPSKATCGPEGRTLCLVGGRFEIEVDWRDLQRSDRADVVAATPSDDSGLFTFFSEDNWEVLIKIIDACDFNDRFWVFAAATTDVEYTIRVTDTLTSTTRVYFNELGMAADAITDVNAFATCP